MHLIAAVSLLPLLLDPALSSVAAESCEISLRAPEFATPLLLGQSLDQVQVQVTFKNGAAFPLTHVPLKDAYRKGLLDFHITRPNGKPLGCHCGHLRSSLWKTQSVVTVPLGRDTATYRLGTADYDNCVDERGWYTLEASLRLGSGVVKSNKICFQVIDERDYEIIDTVQVLAGERDSRLAPRDRDRASAQIVKLGGKYELIYQRRGGEKYGSPVIVTSRLSSLSESIRFTIAGNTDAKNLLLCYPDGANSLTILTINLTTGAIVSRRRQQTD